MPHDSTRSPNRPRIRVAHVAAIDSSLRYLLLNQLLALRAAGFEVVGVSAPGRDVKELQRVGIAHVSVPISRKFSPVRDLIAFWALFRALRKGRFTIVHTHTPKGGLLGQYAALFARVPIRLHTIHGLYVREGQSYRWRSLYLALERISMRFSALNLSQNSEDVSTAVTARLCKPDRIEELGNGIELARFNPGLYTKERRAEIRASLGLRPQHLVVGMVARFVAEKGYREMLSAAKEVRRHYPNARFIFVGMPEPSKSDGLDPEIIQEAGLGDVVHFLGHREDVADLYAVMDVLALPSYREGFPRAPMEAAAMEVPAVVTDIRGCRQVVSHGVTGVLIPPRDADSLAQALIDLLGSEARRKSLGIAARARALSEFDEQRVFSRVIGAYSRLLAQHATASGT